MINVSHVQRSTVLFEGGRSPGGVDRDPPRVGDARGISRPSLGRLDRHRADREPVVDDDPTAVARTACVDPDPEWIA